MTAEPSETARDEHNRYQREYYETRSKRTMQRVDSFYVRHKIEWMVRYADLELGQQVLEVGAGLGKFSIPLVESGHRLTCLDLSPVMLDDLRRAIPDHAVETLACDVVDVARATESRFERIVGFFVLHHFLDLDAALAALARVTRPGAVIAFLEPAASNPLYYVQIALTPGMTWRAERGLLDMRPGRVLPAMRRAGLVDTHSRSFGYLPPFLANTAFGRGVERALDGRRALAPLHAFRLFRGRRPE